jgi:hypothetical protein
MGTGIVSILRLPLSAVVIASLLTSKAGPGSEPLVIIGVAISYLVTLKLSALQAAKSGSAPPPSGREPGPAPAGARTS